MLQPNFARNVNIFTAIQHFMSKVDNNVVCFDSFFVDHRFKFIAELCHLGVKTNMEGVSDIFMMTL